MRIPSRPVRRRRRVDPMTLVCLVLVAVTVLSVAGVTPEIIRFLVEVLLRLAR